MARVAFAKAVSGLEDRSRRRQAGCLSRNGPLNASAAVGQAAASDRRPRRGQKTAPTG